MNTKLHAVTDANGRPISFFMTAGQVSDYTGAAALLDSLPKAQWMLADRGYDADWFRDALQEKGSRPCIPGRKIRNKAVKYDKRRYRAMTIRQIRRSGGSHNFTDISRFRPISNATPPLGDPATHGGRGPIPSRPE